MKSSLHKKLTQSTPYEKEELQWLLVHISDLNPDIRDELVYASFCHALLDQLLSIPDFHWLVAEALHSRSVSISEHALQATLTRSFTALLFSLFLAVDSQEDNLYYQQISPAQRQQLFDTALQYLEEETDTRGWHEEYGWMHAVAHEAELLLSACLHQQFPAEKLPLVWSTIIALLQRQTQAFSAGEERRLALIMSQLISQEKLNQHEVASWIEQTHFPDQSPAEYFAQINFENFLLALSAYLEKEEILSPLLKTAILTKWSGY